MNQCLECGEKFEGQTKFCTRACSNKWGVKRLPERICAIPDCAKKFKPAGRSAKYCSPKHDKSCTRCGENFELRSRVWNEREICNKCSRLKAAEKGKATIIDRYGVENAMQLDSTKEKAKETARVKYGVDHYTQTEEYKAKVKATNLEKHGVEHTFQRDDVKEKSKKTSRERYGSDYAIQNTDVQTKQKETNLIRYGTENVAKNAGVKAKIKATNLERYGVETTLLNPIVSAKTKRTWDAKYDGHPLNSPVIREKIQATLMARYGVTNPFSSEIIREEGRKTMIDRYGVPYALQDTAFLQKQIETTEKRIKAGEIAPRKISKLNKTFAQMIKDNFAIEPLLEKRLGSYSFDLFIEERKLLIDLNPTFTHNTAISFRCILNKCELPCEKHSPVAQDYHYRRALAAKESGYSLIQFFDWDSDEQVLSLLRGKLDKGFKRHSARKLQLEKIAQKDANAFLKEAHVQGSAKGQSHCYGLKDDEGDLVAVATFAKGRFKTKAEYEWVRYAVRGDVIVHGGPNRLFQAFLEDASPDSVVSYVDFNHTTAKSIFLSGCGFVEAAATGASLVWSKDDKRIYNNSLLALGADRLLGTNYGRPEECGMKNNDIMLVEGWLPVYTAGNRVFMWTNSSS